MTAPARLTRLRGRARLILLGESLWRAGWRALCWTGLFAALWLLEIPALFGQAGGIIALLIFIGGLFIFLRRDWRTVAWPQAAEIDRRLERDSGVAHRPLEFLDDRLANPAVDATPALWRQGQIEALQRTAALRDARPRLEAARHDPAALRVLVLLLLLFGFITAGPQWADRLARGLLPFSAIDGPAAVSDDVIVTMTPPAYTHLPRVTVRGEGRVKNAVPIPAGSIVKVQVRGGFGRPALQFSSRKIPLPPLAKGERAWGIEAKAVPGKTLRVTQGFITRLSIPVRYIDDQPPTITLKSQPQAMPRGGLQFDVAVKDDYGVSALVVHVSPDPQNPPPPVGTAAVQERTVMSAPGKDTELKPVFDFTGHPWAGHPVILTIGARDGAGHLAFTPPIHMTLPERMFAHPTARQVVELRKLLIEAPDTAAAGVADGLENILPQVGSYGGDPVTFLALRSAASRLIWNHGADAAPSAVALLWDTALRIEDGNFSLAAETLRAAQDDLQKLLDNPAATSQQLAVALDRVRAAMGQYLGQLYQRLLQRMAQMGSKNQLTPEQFARALGTDQISAFLDQMQAKAMGGDRDAARQMLAQLQQLSDKLDPATSGGEMPPQAKAMMKSVEELQALTERQQKLLDETKREQAHGAKLQPEQPQQEVLRHDLGETMRKAGEALGKIPQSMQQAEQAMRSASGALLDNQGTLATTAQAEAIKQMQQGSQGMQQQLQQMMQQMATMALGPTDPLGRPLGNGAPTPFSDVKIPDEAQRKQVQDILKVLRDRSGDFSRPDYELDYYRRLMKQF